MLNGRDKGTPYILTGHRPSPRVARWAGVPLTYYTLAFFRRRLQLFPGLDRRVISSSHICSHDSPLYSELDLQQNLNRELTPFPPYWYCAILFGSGRLRMAGKASEPL